nr:DUF4352 domain-containing protein [Mammaliicoccus sp. Marseille-Q6498]
MSNSNQSDQNPFNQNTSDQQNSQQENPFNEQNQDNVNNQSTQSGNGNGSSAKPWLFGCGGCLVVFVILAVILGACAAGPIKDQIDNITNKTEDSSTEEESTEEDTTEESTTEESTTEESTTEESSTEEDNGSSTSYKTTNVGSSIEVLGTKITVEKAEFVEPTSKYSKPKKGKVLKVYYKLENIKNTSLTVSDTNFQILADGSPASKFYGMDDSKSGFSFSLKPGESDSGYAYYDVPETNKYEANLQLKNSDNNYRMKWKIDESDVK